MGPADDGAPESAAPIFAKEVRGRILVVSGASGFIGGAVARESHSAGAVAVIGVGRGEAPAWWPRAAHWVTWDITAKEPNSLDAPFARVRACFPEAPLVVVHAASLTASSDLRAKAPLVGRTIRDGTRNLLDWARRQATQIPHWDREFGSQARENVVFLNLSSMEAYGTFTFPEPAAVAEPQVGVLDPEDPRSTYAMAKRESEEVCAQVPTEDGLRAISIRVGHVVGRWCPPDDSRAVASFLRCAREGEDIVLRSEGTGILNVVDSADLLDAMGVLIASGEHGQVYTAVNSEQARTVRDVAELVARVTGSGVAVRVAAVDRVASGYAPPQSAVFIAERLRELGWEPRRSLAQSITAASAWWDEVG